MGHRKWRAQNRLGCQRPETPGQETEEKGQLVMGELGWLSLTTYTHYRSEFTVPGSMQDTDKPKWL